ncbi:MAG: peptide chain release factor N(5)-glutamine methyltransferase [Clostridia bacterium]|nr:peptide chain release factor N(5)-glutamine methyltransferase [Clostridia bacterium]
MIIKELLNRAVYKLKDAKIEQPILKARILMQYTLNKPREYLIIYDKENVTKYQEERYIQSVERLIAGTPLQHITQSQEFMKMNFFVNEDVLIPRPDTEILVEEVLEITKRLTRPNILDLCTGSGAIAVSIAKYASNAKLFASDISKNAITIAQKNAKTNGVEDRIVFIESNLFDRIPKMKFDIIVTNPPYIKRDEIKSLQKDVQNEPKMALDGGIDGLDFYRKISSKAYDYLKYNGYLCMEIGYDQKELVLDILDYEKRYSNTYCKKDLYGNDRIIVTRVGD